ncbi:fibronectin type III domain-containing protein [Campylobacter jejuni]|nr:fibronectin type III domain-containing protein [Campylobacter jejuni]
MSRVAPQNKTFYQHGPMAYSSKNMGDLYPDEMCSTDLIHLTFDRSGVARVSDNNLVFKRQWNFQSVLGTDTGYGYQFAATFRTRTELYIYQMGYTGTDNSWPYIKKLSMNEEGTPIGTAYNISHLNMSAIASDLVKHNIAMDFLDENTLVLFDTFKIAFININNGSRIKTITLPATYQGNKSTSDSYNNSIKVHRNGMLAQYGSPDKTLLMTFDAIQNITDYYFGTSSTEYLNVIGLPTNYGTGSFRKISNGHLANKMLVHSQGAPNFQVFSVTPMEANNPPTLPQSFVTQPKASEVLLSETDVNIEWTVSTDQDDEAITYTLEFYNGSTWDVVASKLTNPSYTYKLPSLNTTNAQFKVKAVDEKGGESDYLLGVAFTIRKYLLLIKDGDTLKTYKSGSWQSI